MKKQIIVSSSVLALAALGFAGVAAAAVAPPPTLPTNTDQCKHNGWRDFGYTFKNQGDCVSFVVTDGRNAPDGPPIH